MRAVVLEHAWAPFLSFRDENYVPYSIPFTQAKKNPLSSFILREREKERPLKGGEKRQKKKTTTNNKIIVAVFFKHTHTHIITFLTQERERERERERKREKEREKKREKREFFKQQTVLYKKLLTLSLSLSFSLSLFMIKEGIEKEWHDAEF